MDGRLDYGCPGNSGRNCGADCGVLTKKSKVMNKQLEKIWQTLAIAMESAEMVDDCGVLSDKIHDVMDHIAYHMIEKE